jgi:redox-sensitive bicupin YhaK (pirin superfamily)
MLIKISADDIFLKDYGWHTGRFHFSFADYEDQENEQFGVLSALNEFVLQPGSGFETHPHSEMEIISYCVEGELKHGDSLGNSSTIQGGDVQYLCAGSGITHSEHNETSHRNLRFFQIWITPNESRLEPKYHCLHHAHFTGRNNLHHIASGEDRESVIQIAQDANVYAARFSPREPLVYINDQGRQTYLVCLDGKLMANDLELSKHDALKILGEESIRFLAVEDAHILLVEMALDLLG